MKLFPRNCAILSAVVAVSFVVAPHPASADGLFDMLFGGNVKRKQRVEDFPAPPKPRQVAVAKISGPSYYDYKAEALARVDFRKLTDAPQAASFEPALAGATFREGVAGLAGFDLFAEPDIARMLADYYSANPDFIWVSGYSPNGRAVEALRILGTADSYGLIPAEYAVTVPGAGFSMDDTASRLKELARFEMTLSARVLRYVRDAQGGRVDPNKLSGYHDFPAKPVDYAGVLKTLGHTQEVRTYLESRHPQNPEYQALRVELEALRATTENAIVVDPKLLLKPGETSTELPRY